MISIIIPVYNAQTYIERCLKSIQCQSFVDFEVLIIDDGSTDNTYNISFNFSVLDKRFRVFHKENGGSASARNVGLKLAKGAYVAFIDADDYVHPDYLIRLYSIAKENDVEIVQCGFIVVTDDTEKTIFKSERISFYTNIDFLENFCRKETYLKTAVLWNKLYKKELFEGLKFPEGKGIDDEYLIYKVIYRAEKIAECDNNLYYYYMSCNSQMRSAPTLKRIDSVEAIEGQLDFFNSIKQKKLYNMLLYRYYSNVVGAYYFVKEYFPDEKETLLKLKKKKKNWKNALQVKEIPVKDKILLCFKVFFPKIFRKLYRKVR